MSLEAIAGTAKTLSYYLKMQEVAADNLANSNTDAFKPARLAARIRQGGQNAVPVQWTDFRQGALRETGRPLDAALDGPGFFVVQTAGGERFTRSGSFKLDANATLTDTQGNPVLGREGPIIIYGAEVEIQTDGNVVVDGVRAGQLRIETVANPESLLKEAGGLYVFDTEPQQVDPAATALRQGRVEEANIDPVLSMVELLAIQRAYSSNVQALKVMDRVMGIAATEVGDISQ